MKLCKYFKICTCRCSGEADEVGEIDELCDIGRLHAKLEKIKSIVDFNLIFPINNITKREIGEKIKSIIEGAENEN